MNTDPAARLAQDQPAPSVETIRRGVELRLRELEPLLDEAAKLRQVIAVLDGTQTPAAHDAPHLAGPADVGKRSVCLVPSGVNKRRILETIAQTPGITPREIAAETGIKRTVVASTVNRLKRRGEVRPHGARAAVGGVALPRSG